MARYQRALEKLVELWQYSGVSANIEHFTEEVVAKLGKYLELVAQGTNSSIRLFPLFLKTITKLYEWILEIKMVPGVTINST